jgi:hypothetical protein
LACEAGACAWQEEAEAAARPPISTTTIRAGRLEANKPNADVRDEDLRDTKIGLSMITLSELYQHSESFSPETGKVSFRK